MNVFVLNCGSSSLKFQIIETDAELIERDADRQLAKGLIERIGSEAIITFQVGDHPATKGATPLRDHKAALAHVIKWVTAPETQIPGIAGLEITVESNGPPLVDMLPALREILEQSRLILMIDGHFGQLPEVYRQLPHDGLYLLISANFVPSEEEFRQLKLRLS